jgi:hypothetical protein
MMLRGEFCTLRGRIRIRWTKQVELDYRESELCGSSAASTAAAKSDFGLYVPLVCVGHIAFVVGIFRIWAARRGRGGA